MATSSAPVVAATPALALPGQLLGPTTKYRAGPGTHVHESNLYSSLLGSVHVSQPPKPAGPAKRPNRIVAAAAAPPASLPVISVSLQRPHQQQQRQRNNKVLPDVGDLVLCRVTRISFAQAIVSILAIGDAVLDAEWQGVIRVRDVRATEKDRVRIHESFRPGDIVRAQVISLGDQANYYLSTASNELGVIMATSEAGNPMYPVSWKEYKDPETGMSEPRKVAKP
ncbi:3'-5' exoribonuclease CSL4 [Magnaporthiopsis poae ATCC 64411]|uniref:3'-5' exoribonuclease CSL4 n=1 Tax=Magnaporthiopsis poae (strain ATCC 64411 / 73-15) TaxID=644358 RepID=A0A0C4EB44_MAGP6|nr:3'-5' exoribonuclease CSL4 [Magnaporthiopsis poae ATCC 64411]